MSKTKSDKPAEVKADEQQDAFRIGSTPKAMLVHAAEPAGDEPSTAVTIVQENIPDDAPMTEAERAVERSGVGERVPKVLGDRQLEAWLHEQADQLKNLVSQGWKLKAAYLENARRKGTIILEVEARLRATSMTLKEWVEEYTDISYSTALLWKDVAANYDLVMDQFANSNPLELTLSKVRDAIRDARQAEGRGKPGSGKRPSQKDTADAGDEGDKPGNDDTAAADEKATGDTARWEREVAKAEAEAAEVEGGETTEPAAALYAVTVMVFTESDQTVIYQALSNWSPISKTLSGTKQARSVSAHVQPNSIGALLHQLGDTLHQTQPRKVRVSIEL